MPLVTMGPMLKRAQKERYGIAAFNMIDYNSVRSIIDGATALNAPIIVQVSTKTIKHWGYKPIAGWVKQLAGDTAVPVALHLDHCSDLNIIKGCIDAGWTSVMFDGSSLPFAENVKKSREAYDLATAAGVGLEAEIGAIGGVEDDKFVAEDKSILANFDECVAFCKEMPKLAVFAPAIGTAHGFYAGEPKIAYDLLDRITAAIDIPIALHGGTACRKTSSTAASVRAAPRSTSPPCTSTASSKDSSRFASRSRRRPNRFPSSRPSMTPCSATCAT